MYTTENIKRQIFRLGEKFLNFKGDRVAFVREYRRTSAKSKPHSQLTTVSQG